MKKMSDKQYLKLNIYILRKKEKISGRENVGFNLQIYMFSHFMDLTLIVMGHLLYNIWQAFFIFFKIYFHILAACFLALKILN